MTMRTQFESPCYRFNYDSLYGVGSFERIRDGATSFLETGSDCQELLESLEHLERETRDCPERFAAIFNCLASEYSYSLD